jgi:hypothetical protein
MTPRLCLHCQAPLPGQIVTIQRDGVEIEVLRIDGEIIRAQHGWCKKCGGEVTFSTNTRQLEKLFRMMGRELDA